MSTHEAMFYKKVGESAVRCELCPNYCVIPEGKKGLCLGRTNHAGTLIAENYGESVGLNLDPIEKKPLYHFRPGSQIVSLGANSCNLICFYCQNYSISQNEAITRKTSLEDLVQIVGDYQQNGVKQVAFTYTEPFTWYEYIYDFTDIVSDVDIILVTNGYVNPEPFAKLAPRIKAMNIDLKSSRAEFYSRYCGGTLNPVKKTIQSAFEHGVHLEITNLLIPGLNDTDAEISDLAEYVASVSKSIPLHFSAYHPAYKSDIHPTPSSTVIRACRIASEKLHYVYAGNILTQEYSDTRCPLCGRIVIDALRTVKAIDSRGECSSCHYKIYGVF
jgi:pyruvate formate lyase activating enzyme